MLKRILERIYHFSYGCTPRARIVEDARGMTCELYCWCGKILSSFTFMASNKRNDPPAPPRDGKWWRPGDRF